MGSDLKTFLLIKGVKFSRKNSLFCANFALMSRFFLVLVFLTPINSLFSPTSQNPMFIFFGFLESLAKSNRKKYIIMIFFQQLRIVVKHLKPYFLSTLVDIITFYISRVQLLVFLSLFIGCKE